MSKKEQCKALTQQVIERKIFIIRGVQVVLDKDLATFYEVKPIRLREQVKRNSNRFPDDFVFQLTEKEVDMLVSQNAIPSRQSLGGYLPYVFTEQGVAAVSAVLKSDKAAEVYYISASLNDLDKKVRGEQSRTMVCFQQNG